MDWTGTHDDGESLRQLARDALERARENLYAAELDPGTSRARLSVLRARVRQAEREAA